MITLTYSPGAYLALTLYCWYPDWREYLYDCPRGWLDS